jgi:hypothetical protein
VESLKNLALYWDPTMAGRGCHHDLDPTMIDLDPTISRRDPTQSWPVIPPGKSYPTKSQLIPAFLATFRRDPDHIFYGDNTEKYVEKKLHIKIKNQWKKIIILRDSNLAITFCV